MIKSNNAKKIEWIAAILSVIGVVLLITGDKFLKTEYDLEIIGSGILFFSIMLYLFFGKTSK